MVTCSRDEAGLLLKHPDIKGISYVGSTAVGLHIYSTAAAHGKRVQALCEAKNHALVMRDAALERSALGIINSTFGCAGMRCMALPSLCVEEACADEFMGYLVKFAKERKIGCAYHPDTELGPLVSAEHKTSVLDWIDKGIAEGAKLVLDGREHRRPRILRAATSSAPPSSITSRPGMSLRLDSEAFGPVTLRQAREGLRRRPRAS